MHPKKTDFPVLLMHSVNNQSMYERIINVHLSLHQLVIFALKLYKGKKIKPQFSQIHQFNCSFLITNH